MYMFKIFSSLQSCTLGITTPIIEEEREVQRLIKKCYHTAKSNRTGFHTFFSPSSKSYYFSTKQATKSIKKLMLTVQLD